MEATIKIGSKFGINGQGGGGGGGRDRKKRWNDTVNVAILSSLLLPELLNCLTSLKSFSLSSFSLISTSLISGALPKNL